MDGVAVSAWLRVTERGHVGVGDPTLVTRLPDFHATICLLQGLQRRPGTQSHKFRLKKKRLYYLLDGSQGKGKFPSVTLRVLVADLRMHGLIVWR